MKKSLVILSLVFIFQLSLILSVAASAAGGEGEAEPNGSPTFTEYYVVHTPAHWHNGTSNSGYVDASTHAYMKVHQLDGGYEIFNDQTSHTCVRIQYTDGTSNSGYAKHEGYNYDGVSEVSLGVWAGKTFSAYYSHGSNEVNSNNQPCSTIP